LIDRLELAARAAAIFHDAFAAVELERGTTPGSTCRCVASRFMLTRVGVMERNDRRMAWPVLAGSVRCVRELTWNNERTRLHSVSLRQRTARGSLL
jgi:hypothetical protein